MPVEDVNPIVYGTTICWHSWQRWATDEATAIKIYRSKCWEKVHLFGWPADTIPICGVHKQLMNEAIEKCQSLLLCSSIPPELAKRLVYSAKAFRHVDLNMAVKDIPWDHLGSQKILSLTLGDLKSAQLKEAIQQIPQLQHLTTFHFASQGLSPDDLAALAPLVPKIKVLCRGVDLTPLLTTFMPSQAQHESAELARAKAVAAKGWAPFYDMVIACTPSFAAIYQDGWPLHMSSVNPDNWQGNVVAVLGEFNKGKSYVLSHLTGTELPSGMEIHTEGLSFKRLTDVDGRCLLLLDTAGANSPIAAVGVKALQEKKAEEEFLRQVAFLSADIFLYVVDHLNAKEQIELFALCKQLNQSSKKYRKVIVVHNLKEITTADGLDSAWQKIKGLYPGCKVLQQRVEVKGEQREVCYLEGVEGGATDGSDFSELQQHFVIARTGSQAGQGNPWVFSKLRAVLLNTPETRGSIHIHHSLLQAINHVIPKFIRPAGEVKMMGNRLQLAGDQPFEVKEQDISYFVSVARSSGPGSEFDEPYDVVETADSIVVTIELPGLTRGEVVEAVHSEATPKGITLSVKAAMKRDLTGVTLLEQHRRTGPIEYNIEIGLVDVPTEPARFENGVLELKFPKRKLKKTPISLM